MSYLRSVVGGGFLSVPKALVKKIGLKSAIFLVNIAEIESQFSNNGEWFFADQTMIYNNTGISARSQRKVRLHLVQLGILNEELRGVPARMFYQINWKNLEIVMENDNAQHYNTPNKIDQNVTTRCDESAQHSITKERKTKEIYASDKDRKLEDSLPTSSEGNNKTFSNKEAIKTLYEGTRQDYKIIALYFIKKGWVFQNKEQFNGELARCLKPAKYLKSYTKEQIKKAFNLTEQNAKENNYDWKLETVAKFIPTTLK